MKYMEKEKEIIIEENNSNDNIDTPKNIKKKKKSNDGINNNMKAQIWKFFPLFLLPTVLAFIIGFVWPFIWGIYLSFFRFKTIRFQTFNGINNYILAVQDVDFWYSMGFTALFALVSIVLINVIAFAVAYALTSKLKGSTIFRAIFFMPNLIGGIVLGYAWYFILDSAIKILFESQLKLGTGFGFWGLIILVCWQQIGYMMIIYIAGLQNVPNDYIEAAKVDGAGGWHILFKIIIPTVMPSITICLFLSLTNSFKLFDQNLALTGGEPFGKTELVALNIYKSFYQSATNMGVGQAKAVIFFIVVTGISLLQLWLTRRNEVQQ